MMNSSTGLCKKMRKYDEKSATCWGNVELLLRLLKVSLRISDIFFNLNYLKIHVFNVLNKFKFYKQWPLSI